jgi:hypothetical protein
VGETVTLIGGADGIAETICSRHHSRGRSAGGLPPGPSRRHHRASGIPRRAGPSKVVCPITAQTPSSYGGMN